MSSVHLGFENFCAVTLVCRTVEGTLKRFPPCMYMPAVMCTTDPAAPWGSMSPGSGGPSISGGSADLASSEAPLLLTDVCLLVVPWVFLHSG